MCFFFAVFPPNPVNFWNLKFETVLEELRQVHLRTMKPAGLPPLKRKTKIRDGLDSSQVSSGGSAEFGPGYYNGSGSMMPGCSHIGLPDVF